MSALSVLRLVAHPGADYGRADPVSGTDLMEMDDEEIKRIRGNEISMIFQEPPPPSSPCSPSGISCARAF